MCSADQVFFPCQEPADEIFDMRFLASKISNVDELVTKIKLLESENFELKDQLKSLKDSSNGIRQLYETEKNVKDQFQNENAELSRRVSLLSQERDILQHEHQNTKVLYEQEVAELKENIDSQTTSINTKTRKKDKVNDFLLENIKVLYENGLLTNKIKKQFLKLLPENMECDVSWLENAECKSKLSSTTKVTKVNKATMCITQSPTVTRSTCTSSFIKKIDVGINVPDDFIAVENILNEIVIDIPEALSPIIELDDIPELPLELPAVETSCEEFVLEKTVEMKSVETMTNLCNIRKKIDYVKKQPRPSSSMDSILQNLKKEPDDKVFSPINLINPQLSSLWILLGRTIFSLIGSNQIYNNTNILTINEQVQQIAKQIEDEKYREYLNQMEMTRSAMQTSSPPPAYQDATITTNSRKRKSTHDDGESNSDVACKITSKKKSVEHIRPTEDDCVILKTNLELVDNINNENNVTPRSSPDFIGFNEGAIQEKNEQHLRTIKLLTNSNIIDQIETMQNNNAGSVSHEVLSNNNEIMDESVNTSASLKKVDEVHHNLLKTVLDELNLIDQNDSIENTSKSEEITRVKAKDIRLSNPKFSNLNNDENHHETLIENAIIDYNVDNINDDNNRVPVIIDSKYECQIPQSSKSTIQDVSEIAMLLPNVGGELINEELIEQGDDLKSKETHQVELGALSDHEYSRVMNEEIINVSAETLIITDSTKNELFDVNVSSNSTNSEELISTNDVFRSEVLDDEMETNAQNIDITNEELIIDNDVIITETIFDEMGSETNLAEYEYVKGENIEFDQSIIVVELIDENDDTEYIEEEQVETDKCMVVTKPSIENESDVYSNKTSVISEIKSSDDTNINVLHESDDESMVLSSNENLCIDTPLNTKSSTSKVTTNFQNVASSSVSFHPVNIFYSSELAADNLYSSSDSEDGLVIDEQCTTDSVKFLLHDDCDIDEILKSFSLPPIFIEPIDEIDVSVEKHQNHHHNRTQMTPTFNLDSPAEPDEVDQIAHLPPKAIPVDRIDQSSKLQKILSPLKPNSIFNKLLSRYNPEVKNKITGNMMPPPRNPKENKMIDRVHFIYGNYLHNMNWCVETLQKICPELQNICRIPKLFVKTIIDIIEPLSATTIESTRDQLSPPLPLFHEKTITFIKFYRDEYLDELFIGELETRMFSLKSELGPQQLTNLTYLYIGMVDCDAQHRYKLRKFIYKCLYYYGFKSIPMIYAVISSYPYYILPKSHDPIYNNTDPMINTIITILMNTNYATNANKTEMPVFKKNEMKYFLTRRLQYKFGEHSITQLVSDLMRQLATNNIRNISYCLILVSKRRGIDWATINIIQSHLMPYLNQLIPNMQQTNEYDKRIVSCLYTISSILKTGDNAHEIIPYLNTFYKILNATEKQIIQEAAVEAILRLSRFSCSEVFNRISSWNPPYKINRRVMLMLNSFIYRKTKLFWENLR